MHARRIGDRGGTTYRLATEADGPALLALERDVPYVTRPFGTRFAVRTDRSPDYFALPRAAGEALHIVAERAGRIVGSICGLRVPGRGWGPDGAPASLGLDLRVRPEARSGLVGRRLISEILRAEAARGTRAVVGVLLGNAREVAGLVAPGRPGRVETAPAGRYVSYALFPRPVRPPAGLEAVPGRAEDLDEIRALLSARYGGWSLAPSFDDLGAPPGAFYVARGADGRLLAAAAVQDLTSLRRVVVEAFGPVLGAAVALLRPAAALLGGSLPRRGEPIRSLALRHLVVADGPEGLRGGAAVLAAAAAAARARRAHVLTVGLPEGDPRAALLGPYPRDPTPFALHALRLAPDGTATPATDGGPVYIDLALI